MMSTTHASDLVPLHSTLLDETMADLVEEYIAEMPERIEALTTALERQDWTSVRRLAHRLKGSAGGYGFDLIAAVAGTVEFAVAYGSPENTVERTQHLLGFCRRVRSTRTS